MRIVLAISSLGGGGAERVMAWLASALAAHGHTVTLLTKYGLDKDSYDLGPSVMRHRMIYHRYLDSSTASEFINAARWGRLLRTYCHPSKADVVLSFCHDINISCLTSLYGSRIPIVVSERTDPAHAIISRLKARVRPSLYRWRAAAVVFQTSALAAHYASAWRLPNVRVIPNAVLPWCTEACSDGSAPAVVSVGRLDQQKGHDILLEAWHRLGADRQGWRLRIVGEGPEREKYESFVRNHRLEDTVELAPFTPDIAATYAGASICVLPSRVEGFPNALIEAMAMGNAVIASNLPDGCREIVTHEHNGLLYDGASAEALANALRRLIGDAEERARLAQSALEVRERYAESAIYRLWEQCLMDACK